VSLLPRDSHLDYLTGLDDEGEEVQRFSLSFHGHNWHRFRAKTERADPTLLDN